ncbi:MAG: hypothetical protein WCC32_19180 [Terriglobales bacterium]
MTTSGIIKICAGIYVLVLIADFVRFRAYKRMLLELIPLVVLLVLDVLIASKSAGYVAFGEGNSPIVVVIIMFVAILLGIAARYVFYLAGKPSWLDLAKPLCISPILLLPLIGSLEATSTLNPLQIISLALLAFQNGFFWQAVLAQAKPKQPVSGGQVAAKK